MTSTDDFYFSLLRVSMLQLLKSTGFDKARPSTVDIFTDLYVKWLGLMLSEINKLSMARYSTETDDTNNIALQDITQAMINLGQIKPVDILDIYDENPSLPSDKGLQLLKDWCINDAQLQYVKNISLPPIDVVKMDLNRKIETMATTKHGFTIGPTKDAPNEGLKMGTTNQGSNIPNNSGSTTATTNNMNDYLNRLQVGQNGMVDEDIQKEILKQDELIDEIINSGDTDDWIKFVLIRQRLNLWNKKPQNNLPTSISQLSNLSGLKNSSLNSMLQATTDENDLMPPLPGTRTNTDYLPIIPETTSTGATTSSDNNNNINNSATLEQESLYLERAQQYMQKLPAMSKDNRLENITLSYENDILEGSSEGDSENDNENASHAAEIEEKDVKSEQATEGFNTDNIHDQIYPDPIEESSNFQLTGTINNQNEDVNNLDLAAMEDMDNTFQRRQSLDFGNPF